MSYAPGQLIVHLQLNATLHGQTIQNGYYLTNGGLITDAQLNTSIQNQINIFKTYILPKIKYIQSQEVVHRSINLTTVMPKHGPIYEEILETSQGLQAYESLPSYCAAILSLRTGFGGRSRRGRSYYAGISAGFGTTSRLDADMLAGLQAIGNELITRYYATTSYSILRYIIFSRLLGVNQFGVYSAAGAVPVTQTIARSVLGTQRHRLIGIGG